MGERSDNHLFFIFQHGRRTSRKPTLFHNSIPEVIFGKIATLQQSINNAMAGVNGMPAKTDYSRSHNMNHLAAEICAFNRNATFLR